MNIYSDISIWWLIPLAILSTFIGIIYYRNQKQLEEISKKKKALLIALRSLAIFMLGILLFGLIVEKKEYKTEKPVFITLVDNSSSMLNYADSGSVKSRVNSFNSKLNERYKDKFDFQDYFIDSDLTTDSLTFDGTESNLDKGFDQIYNQYYNRNIGGICFISDGNFNVGKNPIYSAEKISLTPVFTVGVGDTILKRDQLIRNLSVNEVAFFKNQFPVEVDIEAHKMGKVRSKVSIWKGDKMVASEEVDYSDGNLDFNHVSLTLDANEIGFIQYTVKVEHKDNESSYANNQRSFYVEVIDSRNKVLILTKAPHPDLSAIRQVMEKDENTEVISKLVSDWDGQLTDYALLIWHDPGGSGSDKIRGEVERNKIPVLYMVGNQTDASFIDQLGVGLSYPRGNRLDEVQGYVNSEFQLFELTDQLRDAIPGWPPLTVRFGKIGYTGGNVLISQRIGSVKKDDPILFFGNKNSVKYGIFVGEGLWRWKLDEYAKTKSNANFSELIQKITQYLTVKKNIEPLRISLPKRFNATDDIIINAEFYNSSFERITEPNISFVLTNENNDDIKFEFAKNQSDYVLALGKLKEGKYTWKARTVFNGVTHEKSGNFVITDVSVEALATHANHNLLHQIAEKTNGKFYELSDIDKMLDDIEKRNDIVNVTYQESDFDDLIDWKWIFFFVVFLLSAEWFVRRYSGSY